MRVLAFIVLVSCVCILESTVNAFPSNEVVDVDLNDNEVTEVTCLKVISSLNETTPEVLPNWLDRFCENEAEWLLERECNEYSRAYAMTLSDRSGLSGSTRHVTEGLYELDIFSEANLKSSGTINFEHYGNNQVTGEWSNRVTSLSHPLLA